MLACEAPRSCFDLGGESIPRAAQIAGANSALVARAARHNVNNGAETIDTTMGCPTKKVCNKLFNVALLQDEPQVARILDVVTAAVAVPVTLTTRTGFDPAQRTGGRIVQIAEQAGIAATAVYRRARACTYRGAAEYDTTRAIKTAVRIRVIANGDVDMPEKDHSVLDYIDGDRTEVRVAGKHLSWYCQGWMTAMALWERLKSH